MESIGYKVPKGDSFTIDTDDIDQEISQLAGPQLVVPVDNARYAINATNARWGSLYDAVYGTDILGSKPKSDFYDEKRGLQVVKWVRNFLDQAIPLLKNSWNDVFDLYESDGQCFAVFKDQKVNLGNLECFQGFSHQAEEVLI